MTREGEVKKILEKFGEEIRQIVETPNMSYMTVYAKATTARNKAAKQICQLFEPKYSPVTTDMPDAAAEQAFTPPGSKPTHCSKHDHFVDECMDCQNTANTLKPDGSRLLTRKQWTWLVRNELRNGKIDDVMIQFLDIEAVANRYEYQQRVEKLFADVDDFINYWWNKHTSEKLTACDILEAITLKCKALKKREGVEK